MKQLALLSVMLGLGFLAGCSGNGIPCGNPHPYTRSLNGPKLKAPPGLTLPMPDPAYVIPSAGTAAAPAAATGAAPCMAQPPDVLPSKAAPAVPPPKGAMPPPASASKPAPPVATGGPME